MTPIVIATPAGDCIGMYRPAPGPAVLMCPPFGDEALKTARVWRDLAVELGRHGLASLRIDLPGTGNSAGEPDDPGRVEAWRTAISTCAGWLQHRHDGQIILFGYRFGALMALDAVASGVAAGRLVLLDPPPSGASLARYWRGRARMAGFGAPPEGADYIQAGGVPLSPATLRDLERLPSRMAGPPCPPSLLVLPANQPSNPWPDRLRAVGSVVETIPFEGYDAFVHHDAFRATPPSPVLQQVVAYLGPLAGNANYSPAALPSLPTELRLPEATETPITFGPGNALFGILCRPTHRAGTTSTAVLLPTTGVDPCSGLSRMWTELARRLARQGVTSLRFDMRGVGESEGSVGPDLLAATYHRDRLVDLRHATDALVSHGFAQVTVVAYCSGAYAAWHAAPSDPRITGILAGNLLYLNLQRTVTSDALWLRPGSSRLGLEHGMLASLLPTRGLAMLRRLDDRARRAIPTPLRHLLRRWEPDQRATRRHMNALTARGCEVRLVMAQDDHGHVRLRRAFGERLRLPPGVDLAVIPGADHQFSDRCHRARFLDLAAAFVLRHPARFLPSAAPSASIRVLETA